MLGKKTACAINIMYVKGYQRKAMEECTNSEKSKIMGLKIE